jgi:peptide/nickel transport system permease protein
MLGAVILAEADLSFPGIRIVPPAAAWGLMVYDRYQYLPALSNSFTPGFASMLVVFDFNMMGESLGDVLDSKLTGTI